MLNTSDIIIRRTNICDQIVEYIEERFIQGDIKSGDKLPSERQLSKILNISRTPIREAMRSLYQLGIIETRHGQGTFVRADNLNVLARKLVNYLYSNEVTFLEVLQFRKIIEAESARLAAEYANVQEKEEINYYKERAKEAGSCIKDGNYKGYGLMDTDFHMAIIKASHNSLFLQLFNVICKTIKIQQAWGLIESENDIYHYIKYHDKIYEAIKDKKPEMAYNMMVEHTESIINQIIKKLKLSSSRSEE